MKTIILLIVLMLTLNLNAQSDNCNCCTNTHTEFDFWIGEWTVTNHNNTYSGLTSIVKAHDNCVLQEQWKSADATYTGTSNYFYNQSAQQWEQIWIDNTGSSLHFKGSLVDNKMVLKTDDQTNTNGQTFFYRITWTVNEDGSVRQFWETVTKGGNTVVTFDGLYRKTK